MNEFVSKMYGQNTHKIINQPQKLEQNIWQRAHYFLQSKFQIGSTLKEQSSRVNAVVQINRLK